MNIKEKRMKQKKQPMTGDGRERRLRRRFTGAVADSLLRFWRQLRQRMPGIFANTGRHTTNVRMAAGAGANFYQSATPIMACMARRRCWTALRDGWFLCPPTGIRGGFQKAEKFVRGADGQPALVAGSFEQSGASDYYHTSLFAGQTRIRRISICRTSGSRTAMNRHRFPRQSISGTGGPSAGAEPG